MALDKTATSYYYEGEDKKALKFYEDLASENLLSIENTVLSTTCKKLLGCMKEKVNVNL